MNRRTSLKTLALSIVGMLFGLHSEKYEWSDAWLTKIAKDKQTGEVKGLLRRRLKKSEWDQINQQGGMRVKLDDDFWQYYALLQKKMASMWNPKLYGECVFISGEKIVQYPYIKVTKAQAKQALAQCPLLDSLEA